MKKIKLLTLVILSLITIGYTFFANIININGLVINNKEEFNVGLTNLSNITCIGYAKDSEDGFSTTKIDSDNKSLSFFVVLKVPGDKYSFNVDIKNYGILPAKVNLVLSKLDDNAKKYLNWSVTGIEHDEILNSDESKTLTITLEYKPEITVLPNEGFISNFNIEIVAEEYL